MDDISRSPGVGNSRAYSCKKQGYLEYEMRNEYNQEIPRRVFRDGSQNCWNLEPPRLCGRCQMNRQRECKRSGWHMFRGVNITQLSLEMILTYQRRGRGLYRRPPMVRAKQEHTCDTRQGVLVGKPRLEPYLPSSRQELPCKSRFRVERWRQSRTQLGCECFPP